MRSIMQAIDSVGYFKGFFEAMLADKNPEGGEYRIPIGVMESLAQKAVDLNILMQALFMTTPQTLVYKGYPSNIPPEGYELGN